MMKLEMRMALECSLCKQLSGNSEQLPPTCRPQDAFTGLSAVEFVIRMGFCPACFYVLGVVNTDFLARVYRRFVPAATRFAVVAAKARAMGWKGNI